MKYATLNNNVKMPMAGIGTFLLSPDEAEASCVSALQNGYRPIDTANAYVNEKAVGRAMKKSGLQREEPVFVELGKKYGKAAAQVILRWHIQSGNIVIPGSKNPTHIQANFDLFDFELTDGEMARIEALNKNKRYYTSTPELLKKYAEMVPLVDQQK